jgi:hypothetical protein
MVVLCRCYGFWFVKNIFQNEALTGALINNVVVASERLFVSATDCPNFLIFRTAPLLILGSPLPAAITKMQTVISGTYESFFFQGYITVAIKSLRPYEERCSVPQFSSLGYLRNRLIGRRKQLGAL